jgi:hypothetical protein
MYERREPERTLGTLRQEMEAVSFQSGQFNTSNMEVRAADDGGEIVLDASTAVPATAGGLRALGNFLDIPKLWLERVDYDLKNHVLNHELHRTPGLIAVEYVAEQGLRVVRDPQARQIPSLRMVNAMCRVVPDSSEVIDFWDGDDFRLDVAVPLDFDRGVGGDREVGDITRGGVRCGRDVKHNLAPWAQPFSYRLFCRNGQEYRDDGIKIDARGLSVEEVLTALEEAAERAFGQVEERIAEFYDLRTEQVADPAEVITRIGDEHDLPDRTIVSLIEQIPEYRDDQGNITQFDIVNMVTNQALASDVRNRHGAARNLERLGGTLVAEHADRCSLCHSRLTHRN